MNKKGTLDRFEGDFAIIELPDKSMIDVCRWQVNPAVREGDKVSYSELEGWIADVEATAVAKKSIRGLMQSLFLKEHHG